MLEKIGKEDTDLVLYVPTKDEPTTDGIDAIVANIRATGFHAPATIVGIGGGITLDTAKAVANLLTNPGHASDYQGWDLVKIRASTKLECQPFRGRVRKQHELA